MQLHPHDASRSYSYQHHHQNPLPSTHLPNYVDHSGQPVGSHPVAPSARAQLPTFGHPQDRSHQGLPLQLS